VNSAACRLSLNNRQHAEIFGATSAPGAKAVRGLKQLLVAVMTSALTMARRYSCRVEKFLSNSKCLNVKKFEAIKQLALS